jgi:polysaccharide export outer membrane protein
MSMSGTTNHRGLFLTLVFALGLLSPLGVLFSAERAGSGGPSVRSTMPTSEEYRVQPGDRLLVSVWREETLQREVVVQPDGGIRFPLAGQVNATGLSLAEIERQLTQNLTSYIPEPAVSVSLVQSAGNRVYVVGKVNNPGEYVLSRNIDVLQAIALAGGMTPFADKKNITILRENRGERRVHHFNYSEVSKGNKIEQNIQLMPGDTVVVP